MKKLSYSKTFLPPKTTEFFSVKRICQNHITNLIPENNFQKPHCFCHPHCDGHNNNNNNMICPCQQKMQYCQSFNCENACLECLNQCNKNKINNDMLILDLKEKAKKKQEYEQGIQVGHQLKKIKHH